jgi:hypothetical protein
MPRFSLSPLPLLVAALALGVACDPAAPPAEEGLVLDAPALTQGVDQGTDVSIARSGNYDVLVLRGQTAVALYDVFEQAGGLQRSSNNGLDYLYGSYSVCVSNGAAAACNVYTDGAYTDEAGFAVTFYGERFASAPSELFGALARAQGTSPANVSYVSTDRFVCSKGGNDVGCGIVENSKALLTVELTGLEPLGPDYVYEGWLIADGEPLPAGRFDLDDGNLVTFEFDQELREKASMYVLTIEPAVGDDPAPSDTHVVAGVFNGDEAGLTVGHPAALGDDFASAMGGFILATPSSDMEGTGTQGVWFLDPSAGPGPSLDLPVLPAGWAYEGWVVGNNGPVSTGVFTDVARADSDGAGPAAGPNGAPPFPGQDFIDPAMDLTGAAVVISIEPQPDNSPAPFAFKPLINGGAEGVVGMRQELGNMSDTLATGVASWR